ncbi:MAG: Biotin--protein ligase [Cytophagales bacterium]|nr:biotin--[acetyl-CoA-carboxylase] ligase [Bacteroidota bacterium]MBS1981999.1 biotin--[acetyl-CoA-carboxylase] ligase [Bacteroidota bacterium]WHZ09452.1 MAG: Biotin--protein ligase [Cytophagales bacterium]
MYKIPANTLFVGQRLVFVPECQSTNTLLAEMTTKSALPEGTVVITNHQKAGRGQRGNVWLADAGLNLTLSILLNPNFLPVRHQFQLTAVTSLAVCGYLRKKGLRETFIKWPNDILVDRKKICGILIENSLQGETIHQSIVGIGLNLNQKIFVPSSATSLFSETGKTVDLNSELHLLLPEIESAYLQLRAGNIKWIQSTYLNLLYGKDQWLPFESEGKKFSGKIKDVDEAGRLILSTENGERSFSMKEITFLR